MPNPSHHQTNKSQFADDAGQSKNIDIAAEYLQRDLNKLARWCAKWRIKLNPEKTKVIIFSKSRSAIKAEPALSLYGDLLSYYPHLREVSFFTGRGLLKIRGIRYFFLDQKEDQKIFQIKKGITYIFFKK